MKRFEITLISPISAGRFAKIITAMDVIHQAEFALQNDRLPEDSDRLYLTMSFGSFKIEGFGEDGGAIAGLLSWLKECADPRYRRLISQEIDRRDMQNTRLQTEVEKEDLGLEIQKLQFHNERLNLLDRMVDISNKISALSPDGKQVLRELTKSVRVIADANDDGLISYISELRE